MYRTIAFAALLLAACSNNQGSTSTGGGETAGGIGSTTGATGGVTATNGTGATSSGGGGTGIAISAFVKSYSQDLCTTQFGCQGDATYFFALCKNYVAPGYGDLAAAVDAGRVAYDGVHAQACIADFNPNGYSCSGAPWYDSSDCQQAFHGLIPPGGACESTGDCAGGFCSGDGGCAGTCIAYSGDGGACSATQLCDPSVPYTCIGGVCQPPRDIGEPCGPTTPVCKPSQACIGKICEYLPVKLGKKCVFGQGQCDVGSYCFQPAGQATGTCTAQVQLQGVCGEDNDHIQNVFSPQDFECADGYQANQCQGAGWLLDGGFKSGICSTSQTDDSPCPDVDPAIDRTKPFGDGCQWGLNCFNQQCYMAPFNGPCSTEGTPCDITKAWCNYADDGGTCVPAGRSGDPCTGPGQCGAFFVCDEQGSCQLPTGPVCSPAF